ncbi:MAG: hypothetical protein R2820_11070 [Cyclobacteriaceae bacterium]
MKRHPRSIRLSTIKALLVRTGNQCAFPNCSHPIFDERNLFVAQLCHIEAVSPDGPRFNSENTTEEVNSFKNLVFLCYRHHKETDDQERFSVQAMRQMKSEHEKRFNEFNFVIDDGTLNSILEEINDYWIEIDTINRNEHVLPEFQVEIDANLGERELIIQIKEQLNRFDSLTAMLSKDLKGEYFEILCLGIPNTMTLIRTLLDQLEIKVLEQKLISNPKQESLKTELEKLKLNFKDTAKRAGYFD